MKDWGLSDFSLIPSAPELIEAALSTETLPTITEVRTLAHWSGEMQLKFERSAADLKAGGHDRSGSMMEWAYLSAEAGWSDPQILASLIDLDDRWGKFKRRPNRHRLLSDLINRARQKYGYNPPDIGTQALIERMQAKGAETGGKLVYGWGEFRASDFHIDWILEDLLAVGGFGMVTGFPGVGKTQFCIGLGAHLAIGRKRFLGWENKQGAKKVLFLSLEMAGPPLHHFIDKIGGGYARPGEADLLQNNFLISPSGTPMPLDTKAGQDYLISMIEEHHPQVIIIDSLQKIASKELTDEQAVKTLIHFLSIVRDKYDCAIVVVHHHRKKSTDAQKRDGVELSDVYGSTYAVTDVDWVLSLRKHTGDTLKLEMLKNRLGPEITPADITRDSHLGFDIDGLAVQEQFVGRRTGFSV